MRNGVRKITGRFAAFYSNVNQKTGGRIYTRQGTAQARNTKDNQMVVAAGLGADPLDKDYRSDARIMLADWMTDDSNPFFAKMLVNRYWKHFFGVGIVDPEDDMRGTNPPSNPELLAALEKQFIQSGYDLKALIRSICNSSTYQLSAIPNEYNGKDLQSFSKFNPRRLPAEVMLDSIDIFLGSQSRFNGLPVGTKATYIPDHGSANNSFLDTFGRPAGKRVLVNVSGQVKSPWPNVCNYLTQMTCTKSLLRHMFANSLLILD